MVTRTVSFKRESLEQFSYFCGDKEYGQIRLKTCEDIVFEFLGF